MHIASFLPDVYLGSVDWQQFRHEGKTLSRELDQK
jgi:hypothetical protein